MAVTGNEDMSDMKGIEGRKGKAEARDRRISRSCAIPLVQNLMLNRKSCFQFVIQLKWSNLGRCCDQDTTLEVLDIAKILTDSVVS